MAECGSRLPDAAFRRRSECLAHRLARPDLFAVAERARIASDRPTTSREATRDRNRPKRRRPRPIQSPPGRGRSLRLAAAAGRSAGLSGSALTMPAANICGWPIADEVKFTSAAPGRAQAGERHQGTGPCGQVRPIHRSGRSSGPGRDGSGPICRDERNGPHPRNSRPQLEFDFNDGQIPVTWVGARYRHVTIDYDLLKSARKEKSAGRPAVHLFDDRLHQFGPTGTQVRQQHGPADVDRAFALSRPD